MEQISQIIEQLRHLRGFRAVHGRRRYNASAVGRDGAQQFFRFLQFFEGFFAGTLGGVVGDTVGYCVGRFSRQTVKDYRFYKMAQPRIEKLD